MDQDISKHPSPLKILLVSSSSGSRGGGELYLLYLGRALAQRGVTVTPAGRRMLPFSARISKLLSDAKAATDEE